MAERTRRPSPPGAVQRNFEEKTVAERALDLPDEVLERVKARQRAAIKAMRNFVDRLDDAMPNLVDIGCCKRQVFVYGLNMCGHSPSAV